MSVAPALQRCLAGRPPAEQVRHVSAAVRVNGDLRWTSSESDDGLLAGSAGFPIYSITKTLTAICVLRLSEIGALDLDGLVRHWLPDVDAPDGITLAHLLRHTSGLRDYGPLREYHEAVRTHPSRPWSRRQYLDAVLDKGALFAPGEGWAYSNVGYMLLLQVMERATGCGFATTLQRLVCAPLELQHTFVVERIEDWSRCVPGYGPEVDRDGRAIDVRQVYHPGWCAPGVVASTAEEVTCVFDALLAGRLLGAQALDAMLTVIPLTVEAPPGVSPGYGMGVMSDLTSTRGRNYGHGGGGPGYSLYASVWPDTRLGRVAVATFVDSSSGPRAQECEAALLAEIFDEPVS